MAKITNFNLNGINVSGKANYANKGYGVCTNPHTFYNLQKTFSGDSADTVYYLAEPVNVSVVNGVLTVKEIDGNTLKEANITHLVVPGINFVTEAVDKLNENIGFKFYYINSNKVVPVVKPENLPIWVESYEALNPNDKITITFDANRVAKVKKAGAGDKVYGIVISEKPVNANEYVEVNFNFHNMEVIPTV